MSKSFRLFKPISLALGLLLIVPLIAFSIVQLNGPEIRKQAFDSLSSIAKLKAGQIENWLAERQLDLKFLAAGEGFVGHVERLVQTGNADSRAQVTRRLAAYSKSGYYQSAVLLNASGQAVVAVGEQADVSDPITQQLLQTALKSGQVVHSDLYRDAITGHIHLDFVLPLPGVGGRKPVAAVLLHTLAESFLFPLIQSWPTSSHSGESLLVRRDGNDVLFLNQLRHRHGTALSLRLPLDAVNVPAVVAVRSGKAQRMEGVDYRGIPVFAATYPVPGTPWHLVSKIDSEEVLAPLQELVYWVSLVSFAAVVVIGMVTWRLWRQMSHTQRVELAAHAAAALQESEIKYHRLHESMMDAFVMVDMSGRLRDFNPAFREMLGYSDEELHGKTYIDFTPEKWRASEAQIVAEQIIPHGQSPVYEKEYIRKDGAVIPVELRAFLLRDKDNQPEAMWAIVRDITERKQAEALLRESEQHFRTLADGGSALIWTSGQDKLCNYFNEPWLRFTGRPLEQELGNGWAEGVHPGDLDHCLETYVAAFDQRKPFSIEYRLRHAAGSYRWIRDDGNPRYDSQGEFLGYIGFCVDITEQKEISVELEKYRGHLEDIVVERTTDLAAARDAAESAQRFLRTITDAFPSMVGYWDAELRCGFANIAYLSWFGKKPEEMIGLHVEDLLDDELFRANESYIRAVLRGEPQRFERTLVKVDGSISYNLILYIPDVIDGQVRGFFVLVNDVTELKEAQVELEQINEALQARTLEAESASQAKSVFLANISHEFRTPLNAILGFSDILHRDTGLSEAQKAIVATIHKSGDHLLGLINDVLDIAKIESGRVSLELEPFDVGGMIADVTDMLRIRAREKGLQLQVDQPSAFPRYIVGDEAKLRQILINLISNAIKATERGGVTLRLALKHNHADHLLMEVADSGIGIAPEDQARIFEAFVQVGSRGQQQGTGLGLSIARQFVELMGGKLTLASVIGQGSTFRVELPVQLAQPEEIPQPPQMCGEIIGLLPGQPACRVLVVEDQLENRLLLGRVLERMGFQVQLAENGVDAVAQFSHWRPHFIWMDWHMPVMDGVAAARHIRTLSGGAAVKIAAVTAFTFKENNEELMAAGFDAIVHKPFRTEQIFACMEQLLGLRFVRTPAESETQPLPELDPRAMAALPASLHQALAQALILLNSERILAVIDEIAQTAPELATALRVRAQNYDYEPILALLHARPSSEPGTQQGGTPA